MMDKRELIAEILVKLSDSLRYRDEGCHYDLDSIKKEVKLATNQILALDKPTLSEGELRNLLSQSWYNADYNEMADRQQKKMNEFFEDNMDFIESLSGKIAKPQDERGEDFYYPRWLIEIYKIILKAFMSKDNNHIWTPTKPQTEEFYPDSHHPTPQDKGKEAKDDYYYGSYTEGVDPEVTCWHCKKTFLCDCCDATCRLCGAPYDKSRCEEFSFIPNVGLRTPNVTPPISVECQIPHKKCMEEVNRLYTKCDCVKDSFETLAKLKERCEGTH